jgi:hypothetical protein
MVAASNRLNLCMGWRENVEVEGFCELKQQFFEYLRVKKTMGIQELRFQRLM